MKQDCEQIITMTQKHIRKKTIYVKLKDLQNIDNFLQSRNQSATQYFYSCLKRDGVIE